MTYTYCALNFEKDNVSVVEYSTRNHLGKTIYSEQKYSYTVNGNSVVINGFDTYGVLTLQNGKLIGKQELSPARFKEVVFE